MQQFAGHRAADVVVGPDAHRLNGALLRAVGRQHHNARDRIRLANLLDRRQSILAGHHDVHDDDFWLLAERQLDGPDAVARLERRIAFHFGPGMQ